VDVHGHPRRRALGEKRLLTHAESAEIQMFADRYVGYRLDYLTCPR
jgi:hypothetical protein